MPDKIERPVDAEPRRDNEVPKASPLKDGTQEGVDHKKPMPMRVVKVSANGSEESQEFQSPLEYANAHGVTVAPSKAPPTPPPEAKRPRRGRPPKRPTEQPVYESVQPYSPQVAQQPADNTALNKLSNAISDMAEQNADIMERFLEMSKPKDQEPQCEDTPPQEEDPSIVSAPDAAVIFSNDMFNYTQMYHKVIIAKEFIVLIFDTRYETTTKAEIRKTDKPITITANGDSFIVGHVGIAFDYNNCEYTVLMRI